MFVCYTSYIQALNGLNEAYPKVIVTWEVLIRVRHSCKIEFIKYDSHIHKLVARGREGTKLVKHCILLVVVYRGCMGDCFVGDSEVFVLSLQTIIYHKNKHNYSCFIVA